MSLPNHLLPPFPLDPILLNRMERLFDNVTTGLGRSALSERLGDPRRDLDDECGYPTGAIDPEHYRRLWERDPVANRAIRCLPEETFSIAPQIYEDESIETSTEWESAWNLFGRDLGGEKSHISPEEWECHPVIDEFALLDVLSGVGSYGVMLIGTDDGRDLSQPVEGVVEENSVPMDNADFKSLPKNDRGEMILPARPETRAVYRLTNNVKANSRRLLFLHSLPESFCPITSWEINPTSPRHGLPLTYNVTVNDPGSNRWGVGPPLGSWNVHWTRVLHVLDNPEHSKVFGAPRCRPILNRIHDLQKVYGAGGEGYWRGGFPGISYETHPQLGGDVNVNRRATRDELENYMNGLQRYLVGVGMTAKTLAPNVSSPKDFVAAAIEAICVALDIPMRIFLGSERGELASSQDDRRWKRKLRKRRTRHVSPRILYPGISRFVNLGLLPVPAKGFKVWWADDDSQTEPEKADVALKKTQAVVAYVAGQGDSLIAPTDYLSRVLGMDEAEAEEVIERAAEHVEETGGMTPREPSYEEQKKIDAEFSDQPGSTGSQIGEGD